MEPLDHKRLKREKASRLHPTTHPWILVDCLTQRIRQLIDPLNMDISRKCHEYSDPVRWNLASRLLELACGLREGNSFAKPFGLHRCIDIALTGEIATHPLSGKVMT